MNELIEMIEQAYEGEIQEILQAAMRRYRELYPDWHMIFLSAEVNASDEYSKELLKLIEEAERKFAKN